MSNKLSEQLKVGEPVPGKVIDLFLGDKQHTDDWREEAIEAYDFVAGRQWTDKEIDQLKKQKRPVVVFNRTKTVIDAVSGNEIGNRRTVRYIPREMGDVKPNEIYTAAGDWFRDRSHADDNETDSFSDMLIVGMGWTETRIDYDCSEEGEPDISRVDPLEMVWDKTAKKRNLVDAKRVWRFRTVPYAEAEDVVGGEFSVNDINAKWTEAQSASDYGYKSNNDTDRDGDQDNPEVTIVHVQWMERQSYMEAVDPLTGAKTKFKPDEFAKADARLKQLTGAGLNGTEKAHLVRMQAWLGHVVLSVSEAPSQKGYSWNCITGFRDRNTNLWFGLVRSMRDPQIWANKWLSQTMHILNTNAKGGLMAEKGAFEDQKQAEASWSDPTKITWLKDGALAQNRIKEKTAATYPQGFQQLMEYGVSSIRDVTGVSLEMLGMRENDQAASLEYQRRQSGMTILQPLFDSLKFYRQMQGAVMLDFIQMDLSDGRLIRIVGQGFQKYVPLLKQSDAEYDIIVDDAPTSPNQKEMVWQMFMQLLPTMGKVLPPQFLVQMLKYSPLPSDVVDGLEKMMSQPPGPEQQQQQQLQQAGAQAQVQKTQAEATKLTAEAQVAVHNAQNPQAPDVHGHIAAMAKVQQADLASQRQAAGDQVNAARKDSYDRAALEIQGYTAETGRLAALAAAMKAVTPPPITSADMPQD